MRVIFRLGYQMMKISNLLRSLADYAYITTLLCMLLLGHGHLAKGINEKYLEEYEQ